MQVRLDTTADFPGRICSYENAVLQDVKTNDTPIFVKELDLQVASEFGKDKVGTEFPALSGVFKFGSTAPPRTAKKPIVYRCEEHE